MRDTSSLKFILINNLTERDLDLNEYKVYAHKCPLGIYIGITDDPVRRWEDHLSDSFNTDSPNYNSIFKRAIRHHANEFKHYIISVANNEEEARHKESYAIKFYKCKLNERLELHKLTTKYDFNPLHLAPKKTIEIYKNSRPGSWYSRTDEDRVAVIAEVFIERGRKRIRTIEGQVFPPGMNVECSRAERQKFNSGDLVSIEVALSEKNGKPYLVAAKTAPLIPFEVVN